MQYKLPLSCCSIKFDVGDANPTDNKQTHISDDYTIGECLADCYVSVKLMPIPVS